MSTETDYKLDPVTLEVLKNAFVTIVDEMAEQILRTCHSFVIYCRDFSSALCDARGQHGDAGQPGHRRARRHAAPDRQGRHRGVRRRHPRGRPVRHQRPLQRRHALQRRAHHPADLPRRRADRVLAVQRPLGRRRRQRAGLLRRLRQGALRRGHPDPGGADRRQGHDARRRRRADRLQHARAERRQGRPARPGRVHARRRARDPAAVREVRRRHRRDRVRGGPGLRRAAHAQAHRRAAGRRLGDRGLHRLRPRRGRGARADQGEARDRRRGAALRPLGLASRRSRRS